MTTSRPAAALSLFLPLTLLFTVSPLLARTSDDVPGFASLTGTGDDGRPLPMPLRHTEVRVEISGFVARVEVVQTFGNPFDAPIEANYLFPLPERAAVDDYEIETSGRRIRGEIHRREEAERIYHNARAEGRTAAVLHQERPNIFTQSVANIMPGSDVTVRIRYVDLPVYSDGEYRFLFPMVVGPRFNPHAGTSAASAPVLPSGRRSGHDIGMEIHLDAGVPIRALASDSHRIIVSRQGPMQARIGLAEDDTIPNKDFMLRWSVAGLEPEIGLLAHRVDDDGYFTLLLQPKASISAEEAAPKEVLFVLDTSGSMSGMPIRMSRRFMRLALDSMGPRDRFNIIRFAGNATILSPEPLDNTDKNRRQARAAIDEMEGAGGTMMLTGFRAALSQPHDPALVRIVFFLTDGYIGNESEILAVVRQARGDARIFTLGVGTSVNHYLLREMAALGRGAYTYVRPDGNETEAVERFHRWVTRPYLTDLEIDWGSLRVEDLQPERLPDLYSGQTLSVTGRYLWGGTDTLILRGRLGGIPWERRIEVTLPERAEEHAALASVWARARIRELLLEPGDAGPQEIEARVTALALGYRLMSPFTSFVAVDEETIANPGGNPIPVDQALPMPEMVSMEGIFGCAGPGREGSTPIPIVQVPRPEDRATEPYTDPSSAALRGRVTDTAGTPLPGVVLTIRSAAISGGVIQIVTDQDGRYQVRELQAADDCTIAVDHPGFVSMQLGPVDLVLGRMTIADITLRRNSEVTETIVVETKGNITDAVATYTERNHRRRHGARDTALQYRLDGGNVTDPASGTYGQNLDSDIIEELEVVGSGASAEYGRADGGFANVLTRPSPARTSTAVAPATQWIRDRAAETAAPPDREVERLALHVLADLGDDGALSRAEGIPALAGLLAAQYSDGGWSANAGTQMLAAWAVSEASAVLGNPAWLSDASRRAVIFLGMLAGPATGSWSAQAFPVIPGFGRCAVDPEGVSVIGPFDMADLRPDDASRLRLERRVGAGIARGTLAYGGE